MNDFKTVEEVCNKLENCYSFNEEKFKNKNTILLYAFNGTGKTRISEEIINKSNENEVLCYNAFVEDLFSWNNDDKVLNIDLNSELIQMISEDGLEDKIANNFKEIINIKIDPIIDFEKGKVIFNYATGDERSRDNIKVSKGEESIFIWSVFYTILENVLEKIWEDKSEEDQEILSKFASLKTIIIDDPVSSLDDKKIILIANKLVRLIKEYNEVTECQLRFLITTHHALFYNVMYNSLQKNNFKSYILSKNETLLNLKKFETDAPFSYHLLVKKEIKDAIKNDVLRKYHFNIFRSLLEKTSNFLGYKNWGDCILDKYDYRGEFLRIVNLYSHGRLSDLEYSELSPEEKQIFVNAYNDFEINFKWGDIND